MSDQPKPSPGRVVLFHYRSRGFDLWVTCPAIITRVLDEETGTVNLHVFHDADEEMVFKNDKQEGVQFSDDPVSRLEASSRWPRRWSWPPRV